MLGAMLRRWLACAGATAIVVVIVLAVGPRRDAKPAAASEAPLPPTEQEIRTYVELNPLITKALGDLAMEFQLAHTQDDGAGDEAGCQLKPLELPRCPRIDTLLAERNLTREDWDRLRRRVEAAPVK